MEYPLKIHREKEPTPSNCIRTFTPGCWYECVTASDDSVFTKGYMYLCVSLINKQICLVSSKGTPVTMTWAKFVKVN